MTSPSNSQPQDDQHLQIQSPDEEPQNHHQQQPQSPSTQIETLETTDHHQNPEKSELDPQKSELDQQEEISQVVDQQDNQEQDEVLGQPGMSLSLPIPDTLINISDLNPPLTSPTHLPRRTHKRKKCSVKKQQAIEKKVQTLTEMLKPIPFVPSKTLDFSKHEKLLRILGLWDFVHVEFDRNIRVDLLAKLVVNYDQKLRCSYVNELRINVNRADLGRALKLPVKRDKGSVASSEAVDLDSEDLRGESVSFVDNFVSNWVLLHEDTWIMPTEVLNWTRLIKDGHPEKVDWAGLIWCMVEKELMQGHQLEDCYYASHLQYLMKSQREELFREEPKLDEEVEVKVKEEDDFFPLNKTEEDDDCEMKTGPLDDFQGADSVLLEEHKIELTLGQDIIGKEEEVKDEEMMDIEECKVEEEEEDHGQWLLAGKNSIGEHILQPCNEGENACLDGHEDGKQEDLEEEEEIEEEDEEEGEGMEDGFTLTLNRNDLDGDGLTGNLLQGLETTQIPFSLTGQLRDHSAEPHIFSGGPSIFGNGNKREMGHEHNISHHSLDGSSKRLRTDAPWDNKSSDFGMCMDQVQHWMEKARMMYEAKEQACEGSNMSQQYLIGEVQKRDSVIEHLHKVKIEEIQKRDGDIFRLERELFAMGSLLEGYRKALKETQKAFSEYRQRCQLPEEPIYKDAGPGGVVLSIMEIEKLRQKREEEHRLYCLVAETKAKEFEEDFICKLEAHFNKVVILDTKLMDFEKEVKLLKELSAKPKVSETQDVLHSDGELVAKSSSDTEIQDVLHTDAVLVAKSSSDI